MTYERFRELHSQLNKIENGYSHLLAYLTNQKDMHASILNEFSLERLRHEKEKFSAHACAYIVLTDALEEYEKFFGTPASFNPVICQHNLSEFIDLLNK